MVGAAVVTFEDRGIRLLRALASVYDITLRLAEECVPTAWMDVRVALCPTPTSPARLAAGLHEFGHVVLGPDELAAWRWAMLRMEEFCDAECVARAKKVRDESLAVYGLAAA